MADLLPSSPDTSAAEGADPRVIGVDSDDADDLIAALSSGTARALLAALHDEPANPAKLADAVDTTIQNAQYHLGKLEDAGLIEVVDTVYSEKGREMQVYAPSDRPLVVVAGREEETSGLQAALSRLLGAFAALALGSVLVQELLAGDLFSFGVSLGDSEQPSGGDGAPLADTDTADHAPKNATETATSTPTEAGVESASTEATPTPTPEPAASPTPTPTPEPAATGTPSPTSTAAEFAEQTATEVTAFAAQSGPELAPGLVFFAGGAVVLAAMFAYRYARHRR
jgi:DNA-binding transcriptional ArsR family regulator